jgi:hypothetical protein
LGLILRLHTPTRKTFHRARSSLIQVNEPHRKRRGIDPHTEVQSLGPAQKEARRRREFRQFRGQVYKTDKSIQASADQRLEQSVQSLASWKELHAIRTRPAV